MCLPQANRIGQFHLDLGTVERTMNTNNFQKSIIMSVKSKNETPFSDADELQRIYPNITVLVLLFPETRQMLCYQYIYVFVLEKKSH